MKISVSLIVLVLSLSGCSLPGRESPDIEKSLRLEVSIQKLLVQAVDSLRRGDAHSLEDAESALLVARELDPQDARILDGLGCVALRRGDLSEAKALFQQSISARRDYDRPYAHLAEIAETQGDISAARELLEIAVRLNPLNPQTRTNYALFLREHLRDEAAAKQEMEKAKQVQMRSR